MRYPGWLLTGCRFRAALRLPGGMGAARRGGGGGGAVLFRSEAEEYGVLAAGVGMEVGGAMADEGVAVFGVGCCCGRERAESWPSRTSRGRSCLPAACESCSGAGRRVEASRETGEMELSAFPPLALDVREWEPGRFASGAGARTFLDEHFWRRPLSAFMIRTRSPMLLMPISFSVG